MTCYFFFSSLFSYLLKSYANYSAQGKKNEQDQSSSLICVSFMLVWQERTANCKRISAYLLCAVCPTKAPGPTRSWPGKVAPCRSFNTGKSFNWFLGGWDQELTSVSFADSSSSLLKHRSWPHRAVCGWDVCVNMCILSSESPRPLVLYLSILSAVSVLKPHGGPVPNQVQTCRCRGSQGTAVSHWYKAVHHRCICRATTSNDAISLHIFFFVPFVFSYVFYKTNITFFK